MKKPEDVMEILEAYDLTGSFRAAAGLVGCDHKTVAYWVRQREAAGGMPVLERARPAMEAVFAAKIDELVDRSHGQIRADVAHGKLVAIGYLGSARTTRRWVAESKRRWRRKHGRRTRPWIPATRAARSTPCGRRPTLSRTTTSTTSRTAARKTKVRPAQDRLGTRRPCAWHSKLRSQDRLRADRRA